MECRYHRGEKAQVLDAIVEHLRQLVAAGHYVMTDHAIQRSQERGIKERAIGESAGAGHFRYAKHQLGEREDVKVFIKCRDPQTGQAFTLEFGMARHLDIAEVITLW
jgi:hypothetical protein